MSKKRRGFDSLFIQTVEQADLAPEVLELARLCIKRGVPISLVATKLGATRATVYNWMTGKTQPHPRFLVLIVKLTAHFPK